MSQEESGTHSLSSTPSQTTIGLAGIKSEQRRKERTQQPPHKKKRKKKHGEGKVIVDECLGGMER